ncbi:hypothetical protein ID866_3779 [Astraeus odoratus]|nr:hypothetical protein ID866_3779 [Astraeus odoratus]
MLDDMGYAPGHPTKSNELDGCGQGATRNFEHNRVSARNRRPCKLLKGQLSGFGSRRNYTSMTVMKFTATLFNATDNDHRVAKRIVLHADALKSLKLYSGDVVALSPVNTTRSKQVRARWRRGFVSHPGVLVSRSLLLTARVAEGSQVQITPVPTKPTSTATDLLPSLHNACKAKVIRLREIYHDTSVGKPAPSPPQGRDWLVLSLREHLIHTFGCSSWFPIGFSFNQGLKAPRGILLHGPPGTGKTHLARAIAASTKSSVLVINGPELSSAYHGETEARLRDVFEEARKKSPCIVVLDEIDALAPRREDGPGGEVEKRVVATLLTILDGMKDESGGGTEGRVVVIGTTNRPNAIDPALRRPGRFDREFEIGKYLTVAMLSALERWLTSSFHLGVPDAEARFAILQVLLSKAPHSISESGLRSVASRAHGYVGADLNAVVREAGTIAIKRWIKQRPTGSTEDAGPPADLVLELEDLTSALPTVRPSAMRSVFLETPPVRYSDIGGQATAIQKLREMVEWPLLHPEAFKRLGVRPPKGLLLYGPPGCSKTILARACATESGVNFVAVKGPELLNKYVGESERAVREIFRKARSASPSIIFFDEIDALGTSRAADSNSPPTHEGVLTSLLNEMDGVQELNGVTIVAATNRPDVIARFSIDAPGSPRPYTCSQNLLGFESQGIPFITSMKLGLLEILYTNHCPVFDDRCSRSYSSLMRADLTSTAAMIPVNWRSDGIITFAVASFPGKSNRGSFPSNNPAAFGTTIPAGSANGYSPYSLPLHYKQSSNS